MTGKLLTHYQRRYSVYRGLACTPTIRFLERLWMLLVGLICAAITGLVLGLAYGLMIRLGGLMDTWGVPLPLGWLARYFD